MQTLLSANKHPSKHCPNQHFIGDIDQLNTPINQQSLARLTRRVGCRCGRRRRRPVWVLERLQQLLAAARVLGALAGNHLQRGSDDD